MIHLWTELVSEPYREQLSARRALGDKMVGNLENELNAEDQMLTTTTPQPHIHTSPHPTIDESA